MANNIIRRTWKQGGLVNIEDLRGSAFQAEDGGHTFLISGVDENGDALALSGTPAGVLLRADGQDVTLTCSVSEGVVSATLPASAYVVPGRVGITIFLTSEGQKTAIYAAVGSVATTSSGIVAHPAGSDVVDLVNAIQDAIALIPASDTNLKGALAPTYSTSAVYAVGSYAWYDGKLYKCTTAITSGETWTSAHWTEAKLANDVTDLKIATNALSIIPGETIVEYDDFDSPVDSSITYTTDSTNKTITVTNGYTGGYAALQTSAQFLSGKLTIGKTYRLHASAEIISGSPNVKVAIRGKNGSADGVAVKFDLSKGGEGFVDFVADSYMKRVSLFMAYGTSTKNSVVKFGDIWVKEYDTTGIDDIARSKIEKTNEEIELSTSLIVADEETITPLNTNNIYIKNNADNTIEDGFRLLGNGLKKQDSRYQLIKKTLTRGCYDLLNLSIKNVQYYQFQTTSYNVPQTGTNSYLIDSPVAYGGDDIEIPETAGYIIMSVLKSMNNAGLFINCSDETKEYMQNGGVSKYNGPFVNRYLTGTTYLSFVEDEKYAASRYIHLNAGDSVSFDFLKSGNNCKIVSFKRNAIEKIEWPSNSNVPVTYVATEECFAVAFVYNANGIDADEVSETLTIKRGYQGYQKAPYDLLPSYWKTYLDSKIPEINADSGKSASGDAFVFFTDYHMKNNAKHTPSIVKTIMDNTDIRFAVHGGDVLTQETTQANALSMLSQYNKSFDGIYLFNVIGNHDQNNPGESEQTYQLTNAQAYSMLCKKNEGEYISTDGIDYCFDNKAQKIRYFMIGSQHQSWIVTSQVLWFCNQLLEVPDDYDIFVISHLGLTSSGVNGNFQYILNAMEAYQGRQSDFHYSTSEFDYSNATANIIGAISGHSHKDLSYSSESGFPVIGTTTDAIGETHTGTTMSAGETTEQAFDIVRIDKANKKIWLTRIGAGSNRDFSYTT